MSVVNPNQIAEDTKRYIQMRYDMLRLELLEKTSQIISLLLIIIISLVFGLAAFIYFSFALVAWLKPFFGSAVPPLCIIGGLFVLLIVLMVIFKKHFFLNPLIGKLSEILFKETTSTHTESNDEK